MVNFFVAKMIEVSLYETGRHGFKMDFEGRRDFLGGLNWFLCILLWCFFVIIDLGFDLLGFLFNNA